MSAPGGGQGPRQPEEIHRLAGAGIERALELLDLRLQPRVAVAPGESPGAGSRLDPLEPGQERSIRCQRLAAVKCLAHAGEGVFLGTAAPVLVGERIAITSDGGLIYLISPDTGKQEAPAYNVGAEVRAALGVMNDTIYINAMDRRVWALQMVGSQEKLWQIATDVEG